MKLFTRLANKKRAISPVISVILLIALAVAAVAALFLVVIPILTPKPNLQMVEAFVDYDDKLTTASDIGEGYGKGTLILSNSGQTDIKIVSVNVYYASSVMGPWTEIENHDKQVITESNPYEELRTTILMHELTVGFPIPDENDDTTIFYKITITTSDETVLDTSTEDNVDETKMQLKKDRPDISFTGALTYIRRKQTISPTSVSDNSEIKNVTYQVYNSTPWSMTETITSSLWKWNWDTHGFISNGSYNMTMTVYDYAGLSATTGIIDFTIDNDYVDPEINGLWVTAPYPNNETAEVGESVSLTAEIIDGGTAQASASQVDPATVYLYYRLNGTANNFALASMNKYGTTNNWTVNIPSSFLDSDALESGIESYVSATDLVGNTANSSGTPKMIQVNDNYAPDISHTPIVTGSSGSPITINATITDEDQVNQSSVLMYWRQTDNFGGVNTFWTATSPTISGDKYSWYIWGSMVTIHGIDYYINASDRFSGHVAYAGTPSVPHHINIPDTQAPTIYHTAVTTATDGLNLTVECIIWDNDPTFGAAVTLIGTVKIHYRDYASGGPFLFSETSMTKISGDSSISSNSETPSNTIWSGIIPASAIQDDEDPSRLDYYIYAEDQSGNSKQDGSPYHQTTVVPQGEPILDYISGSVRIGGTENETISLIIRNNADPGNFASANLSRMQLTIFGSSGVFTTYYPILNTTKLNDTQFWIDTNGVANESWITFTTNFTVAEGETCNVTMTFHNTTTGQAYDMHDLSLSLTFEVYNGLGTAINITIPTIISTPSSIGPTLIVEPRYMRLDQHTINGLTTYQLGNTQSSGTQISVLNELKDGGTITWGIRVWVRTQTGIEFEITPASTVANVTRNNISSGLQSNTWNAPKTSLSSTTDAIVVRVYHRFDSNPDVLDAEFITEQLGATSLESSTWTVYYWTQRSTRTAGPNTFTQSTFYFGTSAFNSRVENFTYFSSAG